MQETIGKLSHDLMSQDLKEYNALDLQKESEESYIKSLRECAEIGLKKYGKDFFIEVLTQNEKILSNVFRNKFNPLICCPEPNYDQSVYKFHFKTEQIEHIWTIPDRESSHMLLYYRNQVVPEERQILSHVIDYANGTLFRKMKAFNNEKLNSPELNER